MSIFARFSLLAGLLVFSAPSPAGAQDVKSLPLDPEAYKQIVAARSRIADQERFDRVAAQYRGEWLIERVNTAQVDGERAVFVTLSPEKLALWQTVASARLEAVRSIDPWKLDDASRLDWRVLRDRLETDALAWRDDLKYASPIYHRVATPFGNFSETPETRADYEDRLAWLRGVPIALAGYEATLRKGLASGMTDSRVNVTAAIAELRAAVPENPLESVYLEPFKTFPASIAPDEQTQVLQKALGIYRDRIRPAYQQYVSFVENTYLPRARSSARPAEPTAHGQYAVSMRRATGLEVDPAAVHESAVAEVTRLHGELKRLAGLSGFKGSGAEYLIAIRNDPKCAPLDALTAKKQFDTQMHRIEAALPRVFAVVPPVTSEFEPAPDLPFDFGEAAIVRGSAVEGRPGRVRVKVPVRNACGFLNVMRHDGVPGHLFQAHTAAQSSFAAARRLPGAVRAYGEGWAEYASDLAPELGLQLDEPTLAERVGGRLFMAARTAVDVGVNWYGWSAEKATAYYRDAAPWALPEVVELVVKTAFDRPAMQAAYFIGARKMAELRDYATAELGEKFDVRQFHTEVLKYGPLPLGVLEDQIHDWVQRRKRVR